MHPSNKVTPENLDDIFTYQNDERRLDHYKKIRAAAYELSRVILNNAPACADRSAAFRAVREAVLWANAAVALATDYPWEGVDEKGSR